LVVFDELYFGSHFGKTWYGITIIPALAVVAVVFGAVQHEHNVLAKHMGVPLPCDDPLLTEERISEELHTAGAAPSHETLKSPWRPEHGVAVISDSGREMLYPQLERHTWRAGATWRMLKRSLESSVDGAPGAELSAHADSAH
jgi:hypothetical protein